MPCPCQFFLGASAPLRPIFRPDSCHNPRMTRIKGFAIRGVLKQVKTAGGGGIPAVLAALPEGAKGHFARSIVNSNWYPYEAFAGLLEAVDNALGRDDPGLMARFGRTSGREDFGTIFKVIAAIASVEMVLKRGAVFWGQYCDGGTFEMIDIVPGQGTAKLVNFPTVSARHCRLIEGWIRGIGEAVGAKNISVAQTRCVHKGDSWCEYQMTWEK